MPPKRPKRKAKAKAKGSAKRSRHTIADTTEDWQLPDFGEREVEGEEADPPDEAPEDKSPSNAPDPPSDEDNAPLLELLPKKDAPADAQEAEDTPELPSFAKAAEEKEKEDEDGDQPMITGASLSGDLKEGDVWHQLEKELQAPLEAPSAPQEAKDDYDEEWGITWRGEEEEPETANVLDEIARNAASATWHQQEWSKKEETHEDEPEVWGEHMYKSREEVKAEKELWAPDLEWECTWEKNSKEAMAIENVVRKIRSRCGESTDPGIEAFPNETMLQVISVWTQRTLPEQRVLLAAVLFLEASTLEMAVVAPDLNGFGLTMMMKEEHLEDLRAACQTVPQHLMLRRADAAIPTEKMRKEQAVEVIGNLKKTMSSLLVDHFFSIEEEELSTTIDEVFVEAPLTVLIMGLVHCCEYLSMMKRLWDSRSDLNDSLEKQKSVKRSFELLCRIDLQYALDLAQQCLNKDGFFEQIRKSKTACLNRLGSEWRFVPTEEDLMRLHMLPLERQIQVLLKIERDIELKWCDLMTKVDGREERSAKLREYLDFHDRLRPYLNEDDLMPGRQPLELESGQRIKTSELALVRQGVSEVFKKLKQRYKWKPEIMCRKAIFQANWVARLSASLRLAKTSYTLSADKELRQFLRQEGTRILGNDVYANFTQWFKMEEGDGMQVVKRKVASEAVLNSIKRKCEEIENSMPQATAQHFQPQTPAGLGAAAMTPGLAAMTPGLAAMTPGLNPGTPGAVTPGYRAPTPTGYQPGPTPAYKEYEGGTPQWRPASTPLGPTSSTPMPGTLGPGAAGTPGRAASRTPMGMPPPTPVKQDFNVPPRTPVGTPPPTPATRGGPQPMTPEVRDTNVKAE